MAYRDVILADSPVDYYEFETTTGTDSGSGSRTLTRTGPTADVVGKVGDAWSFDGVNDYATHTAFPSLTTAYSIEAWVKAPSAQGMTGDYHTIVRRDGTDIVLLRVRGSNITGNVNAGQAEVYIDGTVLVSGSSYRVDDGNWHHLVYTQSGNTARLYVDGVERASATTTQSTFNFGTGAWYVGSASGTGEYFKGTMDEVALYNTALSGTRIAAHYSAATVVNAGYTAQPMIATGQAQDPSFVGVPPIFVYPAPMTGSATTVDATAEGNAEKRAVTDDSLYVEGNSTIRGSELTVMLNNALFKFEPATSGMEEEIKTLYLTKQSGTTGDVTFYVFSILNDWSEATMHGNNEPSMAIVNDLTQTVTVPASGVFTLDITGADIGFGVMIQGDSSLYVHTSEAATSTNRPYALTVETEPRFPVTVTGEPFAASATMTNATGGGTAEVDVFLEAESLDAYADMPGGGFSQSVTVTAESMTAGAESFDADPATTAGVNAVAEAVRATARWVKPAMVNDTVIEVAEEDDPYFQRVEVLNPDTWLRLNDKGSTAKDRVTEEIYGTYHGVLTGRYDAPEERHSVYFDGNDFLDTNEGGVAADESTAAGRHALEFSFRTEKQNAFIAIGQDTLTTNGGASVTAGAREIRLTGGRITFRSYRFGPGFTQSVESEFSGTRRFDDGQWHHVVVRTTDTTGPGGQYAFPGVEIWVDGKFEVRRYGIRAFMGFPDYIGGRPNYIEVGSDLPGLPGSEWFEGDMSEFVWYSTTSLDKESIPRNYYAFMGWSPIEADSMDAFAFTPAGHAGRGNQKRMLALTWNVGETDFYDRASFRGTNKPSTDALLAFSEGVTDYEGYKVFGRSVYGVNGVPYRDAVTDEFSLIDLERDVNVNEYDVIYFQDWPDEGAEIDFIESQFPGQRERLLRQLREANDKGVGLFVTHPRLAVDLGIVDRVEWVPTLRETRYSPAQGNAAGQYDYGSAYKFPWNIAGSSGLQGYANVVGSVANGVATNRDPAYLAAKAFYYGDTNKNDRFRVRALIEGLTDIPSYMIQDAVFQVDYDPWGWNGVAYKYLHRMDGLQIGDEYIFHGTDHGRWGAWSTDAEYAAGRYTGTWATPMANVKAGTIVTTFGATHWVGTQVVENPYKDYATTIVLEPGDSLGGRAVGGKIFVNYSEQPNLQPDAVVIQKLPDGSNGINWPGLYTPDTAEQREWEWSFTRVTLNSTQANPGSQTVNYTDPTGNVVSINVSNQSGSNLAMVRSAQLFPLEAKPHFQMVSRGLLWLMDRVEEEPGSATVRAEAITATGAMPNAAVLAERDAEATAQPMRALGVMPKVAEDTSGDVEVYAVSMEARADFTGFSRVISAAPMTATAELVENFDFVHTTGEQVVLTLYHADATLFIKEEA